MSKKPHGGLEGTGLHHRFPKTMAKPAVLFGKKAGHVFPAPWLKEMLSWLFVFLVPLLTVLLLLSRVFAISTINQVSMLDTLVEGDLVFCVRPDFTKTPPRRGDIVLFYADNRERGTLLWEFGMRFADMADNWRGKEYRKNLRYVKRVIGLPGETVDLREGRVYIEGEALAEPYALTSTEVRGVTFPLVVPQGEYLLLGDNRARSEDSRDFGCIRTGALEGIVRQRLLPVGRAGRVAMAQ
jgi:signal peptidase I